MTRYIRLSHADTVIAEELRAEEGRRVLALEAAERKRQGRPPIPDDDATPSPQTARREGSGKPSAPPGGLPPSPPPARSGLDAGGGGGGGTKRSTTQRNADDTVTMTFTKAEAKLLAEMTATHPWVRQAERAAGQAAAATEAATEQRRTQTFAARRQP